MPYQTNIADIYTSGAFSRTYSDSVKSTAQDYTTIEYPTNSLGQDKYPHFVTFFINDLIKATPDNKYPNTNEAAGITAGVAPSKVFQNAAGGVANLGSNLQGAANQTTTSLKKTTGLEIPQIKDKDSMVTVLNEFGSKLTTFGYVRKRLTTAICLPMPIRVMSNYSAKYGDTDAIGAIGGVIMDAIQGKGNDMANTALFGAAPAIAGLGIGVIKSAIAAAPLVGSTEAADTLTGGVTPQFVQQLATKLSGMVLNRRQEKIFNNMEFRSHNGLA